MPQLMPLNWIFSSMMVLLIITSMSVMYSEKISLMNADLKIKDNKMNMIYWCW